MVQAAGGRREAGGAGRQDVRGTGRQSAAAAQVVSPARCSLLPTPAARPQLRPGAAVHLAYGGTAPAAPTLSSPLPPAATRGRL